MTELLPFLACLAAATALVRAAPALGWVDRVRPGEEGRKAPGPGAPEAGGAALLAGVLAAAALGHLPLARLGGLAAAFGLGLADDLAPRGLGWRAKLAGQVLAALLLAAPELAGGGAGALLVVGAAVVAMNLVNTWDHADGAAVGLGVLGLGLGAPVLGAAVAGLLPWNPGRPGGRRLYLGDSGSHLLGALFALTPLAWGALLVPTLDLARVALARRRAGAPVTRGDRRHFHQVLERRGRRGAWVLGLAAGLPAALAVRFADASPALLVLTGCLASSALWALALQRTTRAEAAARA